MQMTGSSSTGLSVYADIGPSSFKKRQAWTTATSTFELDDSHVEYAKLNHNFVHKATVQISPNMVKNELNSEPICNYML